MTGILPKELLIYFRSTGMFPVASVSVERAEQFEFKLAVYIYSICLVVFQTCLSSYSWLSDMQQSFYLSIYSKSNTVVYVMFCDVLTLVISAIVCVLSSGFNCSQLVTLYCDIQRVDDTLKVKAQHSHFRWWLYLSLVHLTTVLVFDYFSRSLMSQVSEILLYISLFSLHYTDLAVQLQYTSLVYSIYQRFRLLNQRIADEVTRYRVRNITRLTILPAVETPQGGWCGHLVEGGGGGGVRTLSDLHWLLCGATQLTNAIFSWPLLAHMLSLFLHVIIAPYFFFFSMNVYSHGSLNHHLVALLAMQVVWVLTHAAKLVLLIWPCSLTTYEAGRTASIVCKLLNCEMSPDMRKQLETFVLQLLHHNAEFTAFGLFPLQCPILTSIAGAVTTYLVILIQFQNADTVDKNSLSSNIVLTNNSIV